MSKAVAFLQNELIKFTRVIYDSAWTKFHNYIIVNEYQSFPIIHNILINWIVKEIQINKVNSVKQYIFTLQNKYIDKRLSLIIFSKASIAWILTRAMRIQEARSKRERLEITKDILLKILIIFYNNHNKINFRAIFCVIFITFLYLNEFI